MLVQRCPEPPSKGVHWPPMVMLTWLSALGGGAIARHVGEIEVELPPINGAFDLCLSIVNCERSTCGREGSSLSMVMLWDSDLGRDVVTRTVHPFDPSGYTTQASECKSLWTSNWQILLHGMLLGIPSIMAWWMTHDPWPTQPGPQWSHGGALRSIRGCPPSGTGYWEFKLGSQQGKTCQMLVPL